MVGRDVEQHADASARARARGRSGRTSTRSHGCGPAPAARAPGSACRYCRPSARRGRPRRRIWAISAVVVDLPLVPVMATKGAAGAILARSRQKSSMSPMISTPAALAELDRPVRLGMGQRHARRRARARRSRRQSRVAQIVDRRSPSRPRLPRAGRRVVPGQHAGAAGGERRAPSPGPSRRARRARRRLPAKEVTGVIAHRSFRRRRGRRARAPRR